MVATCDLCRESFDSAGSIYCPTCVADQDQLSAERPELTEQDLELMAEQAAWHLAHNVALAG